MIQITEAARDAMATAIEGAGQPIAGLRLMVQSGGCAGLQYAMALELSREETDAVVEAEGVTVLIDPDSQGYLVGTTIDFVNGLEGSGFVFDNPNASAGCGCGKSFC
ncbi:HesB/IscA family protein [Rhodovulum adriaticum]|uniref:Iron-sulfur cluster assembly accessory protein n=1 Tax=Rhodovulum adriaticum TaxID=35804 RepID=A0A4R2NIC1_RHOAD|nr:iron-sulfur cluster assembly accessory protein [Rhodovulum adriaticum]MBK1635842.1 iron-sulfur cluster assembly accessory protein [Rhodovulum adriaticum]TCP20992.1 iron-sulfur cluster assembly accessory protein [Rhodovulum adriaticum]